MTSILDNYLTEILDDDLQHNRPKINAFVQENYRNLIITEYQTITPHLSLNAFCKELNISKNTYYNWINTSHDTKLKLPTIDDIFLHLQSFPRLYKNFILNELLNNQNTLIMEEVITQINQHPDLSIWIMLRDTFNYINKKNIKKSDYSKLILTHLYNLIEVELMQYKQEDM